MKTFVVFALAIVLLPACKGGAKAATDNNAAPRHEYTAAQVWSELGRMSHMDRVHKFKDDVTVVGTVKDTVGAT